MTLVFEKNANFFAENWQKMQKIVIKTSTPGWRWRCNSLLRAWIQYHLNRRII
jgi:hypothetical protein